MKVNPVNTMPMGMQFGICHALQATIKRVDFAYTRFFKGLGKYPRFKSIRHYSGWTYPCRAGWQIETDGKNGYLTLSNLGRMQLRGKARTWGKPTTCTIVYRHGYWYASLTVQCQPERQTGTGSIGKELASLDSELPIPTLCGSMKQMGALKRQKPRLSVC